MEKKILQLIQTIGLGSPCTAVSAYMFERWMTRCWPVTLGNFLFPECVNGSDNLLWSNSSIATLIVMLHISYWLLIDIVGTFIIVVIEVSFMSSYALKYFLKYFKVVIMSELFELGASSEISFSKVEIMQLLQRKLAVYRELEILSKLYNFIQKDVIIISIMGSVILGIVASLYCFISLGADILLPQFIIFSVILINSVTVIVVVFGTFGQLNDKSIHVLDKIKKKVIPKFRNKTERKWLSKCVRSMPPLKVRLGNVNFVDSTTPLVLLDFSLGILVNLLLI